MYNIITYHKPHLWKCISPPSQFLQHSNLNAFCEFVRQLTKTKRDFFSLMKSTKHSFAFWEPKCVNMHFQPRPPFRTPQGELTVLPRPPSWIWGKNCRREGGGREKEAVWGVDGSQMENGEGVGSTGGDCLLTLRGGGRPCWQLDTQKQNLEVFVNGVQRHQRSILAAW